MNERHEDLRLQLEDISDQLGDRIMAVLREAIEAGAKGRPAEERLLSRARAAVDKAATLVDQAQSLPES
ncbi:MAG: hypothetical protein JST73_13525 [Actinobacteria bacterium]|nr:hypothetical protein [Actinomycetota bacterium]